MDNSEEQDRIHAIQNGDPGPYAYIVNAYKHMAYTIAIRILKNEEDAEDAAQESFIKAYQQIKQFKGTSKFSTWLYTIVYRTAISKSKENRFSIFSISRGLEEGYAPEQTAPQHEHLRREDEQKYVREAIQNLPGTEALVVTLFYLNENSIKEIGEITGMSSPLIKIKLFRGRKKLERELKGFYFATK